MEKKGALFFYINSGQLLDSPRSWFLVCCYDYPFQSCSTDIPVLQIQPWITSDPVIAFVFLKVSWCLGKT